MHRNIEISTAADRHNHKFILPIANFQHCRCAEEGYLRVSVCMAEEVILHIQDIQNLKDGENYMSTSNKTTVPTIASLIIPIKVMEKHMIQSINRSITTYNRKTCISSETSIKNAGYQTSACVGWPSLIKKGGRGAPGSVDTVFLCADTVQNKIYYLIW